MTRTFLGCVCVPCAACALVSPGSCMSADLSLLLGPAWPLLLAAPPSPSLWVPQGGARPPSGSGNDLRLDVGTGEQAQFSKRPYSNGIRWAVSGSAHIRKYGAPHLRIRPQNRGEPCLNTHGFYRIHGCVGCAPHIADLASHSPEGKVLASMALVEPKLALIRCGRRGRRLHLHNVHQPASGHQERMASVLACVQHTASISG